MKKTKVKRIKGSKGPLPPILGKGSAHTDKSKYTRKVKHNEKLDTEEV